jgi:hypothetical protein
MIVAELTPGVSWKKDRQDTIFLKNNNFQKIPRNSYFAI